MFMATKTSFELSPHVIPRETPILQSATSATRPCPNLKWNGGSQETRSLTALQLKPCDHSPPYSFFPPLNLPTSLSNLPNAGYPSKNTLPIHPHHTPLPLFTPYLPARVRSNHHISPT